MVETVISRKATRYNRAAAGEMSVSLGIKEKANIWKCKACNSLLIKCPYCNNEMDIHMAKAEFCDFCKKSFYLCT